MSKTRVFSNGAEYDHFVFTNCQHCAHRCGCKFYEALDWAYVIDGCITDEMFCDMFPTGDTSKCAHKDTYCKRCPKCHNPTRDFDGYCTVCKMTEAEQGLWREEQLKSAQLNMPF